MLKKLLKPLKSISAIIVAVSLLSICFSALAAPSGSNPMSLTDISSNVDTAITSLSQILENVALVAGIGFILVSFFKFHQHKLNPTQVPISQGITLLVIGAALTIFPKLIEAPSTAFVGSAGEITHLSSNEISGLIS